MLFLMFYLASIAVATDDNAFDGAVTVDEDGRMYITHENDIKVAKVGVQSLANMIMALNATVNHEISLRNQLQSDLENQLSSQVKQTAMIDMKLKMLTGICSNVPSRWEAASLRSSKLIANDGVANDEFGRCVAATTDMVVVGALTTVLKATIPDLCMFLTKALEAFLPQPSLQRTMVKRGTTLVVQ
eukprot:m.184606 g.184606  ORF g.184606 m.184606 type:complete len:187 (+) comp16910_c0_seq1:89-649(+)